MQEKDPLQYPRLRPIEAFPAEMDGRRVICLRDPAEIAERVLALSLPLIEVISNFDGEHSLDDIRALFLKNTGHALPLAKIEEVVRMLDEGLFLETPRFEEARLRTTADFLSSATRPAFHAGGAYESEPGKLAAALAAFGEHKDAPGKAPLEDPAPVSGLIAPHIDFTRGGPAYVWAYRDLPERTQADTFVIFGTCHAGMDSRFCVTQKAYDTPFGPAQVDIGLVSELSKRFGENLFTSEFAHRAEHSIEFQAVWLKHLFEGKRPIRIVPILTSLCHEFAAAGMDPSEDESVERFFKALNDSVRALGRKVCYVAGADLAHVGPRFGDASQVGADKLAEVEQEDRRVLAFAEQGDASGFHDAIAESRDRNRICGWSPIYATLRALDGDTRGVLRRYAQWPDPDGTVTFASMTFHKRSP